MVKLTKPQRRLDLRGDNRLPVLLDERERLKVELKRTQDQLKELDTELRDKLGDAQQMVTDGWMVSQSTYIRNEYTVPASTMHRLTVKRTGKRIYNSIDV